MNVYARPLVEARHRHAGGPRAGSGGAHELRPAVGAGQVPGDRQPAVAGRHGPAHDGRGGPAVGVPITGAVGTVPGVTGPLVVEGPYPTAFAAAIWNVYAVPLLRPVTWLLRAVPTKVSRNRCAVP